MAYIGQRTAPVTRRGPQDIPAAPFGFAPPPSKMQQTLSILNEYNPLPAFGRLMESPFALGFAPTEQDIADGLTVAGGVMGGGAMVPKPRNALNMGIKAYHGSPHDFDAFSMSKIGTGEGAQAYGHGLYFAENEGVAKGYKNTLSDTVMVPDGTPLIEKRLAQGALTFGGNTPEGAIAWLDKYKNGAGHVSPALTPELAATVRQKFESGDFKPGGHMYEVNIDADPNAFLDWDKPLSEQPEVLAKLQAATVYPGAADKLPTLDSGERFFRFSQNYIGEADPAKVSQKLKDAGVPGIKYADAGTRGQLALPQNDIAYNERLLAKTQKMLETEKSPTVVAELKADISEIQRRIADAKAEKHLTRNYVVFDDRLISIVRKYGIAGASAMLGYNILEGMDPAQAAELKQIEGNQ